MRSPQPQSPSALTEPPSSRESSCFFEPGVFSISADSDGDGCTEASYGVHCLLHDAGTVEPVIISSLYTHTDASSDDEVVEEVVQRIKALWRSPHRCVTAPVGVSSCRNPSGTRCLLYVEQLRSSSSLQSMILRQMEQPLKPLYSMKQALEWLIQLASALAHLHSLQPEVPHGRLSTSIIAVTSAAEISLGRCISTLLRQDSTPSSKRMHVVDSTSICSGSLECEPDPLVPEAIRPSRSVPRFLAGPFRRSSAGMSVAFTSCPHSSPQFDALQRRHSVAGPDDSLATYPDSLPLHSRAMFMHRLAAPWRHDTDSIDAAMHALSLQAGGGSAPGGVADKAAVSSTELPGVGTVFKVSVPGMRRNAGESLFEAAEAAVWSRSGVNLPPGLVPLCPTGRVHMNVLACTTMHNHASSHNINVDFPTPRDSPEFADTGSEVKQHGGAFFAKTMSTPLLHNHSATALDVMDDSRRFSEESQEVGGNSPGGNSSATGNTTTRSLDAADTEHILLSCPLMWRKNSERNGQAQAGNVQGQTPCAAPQHMYTTSSTAHVFSRAVARSPLEASSGLACRDWLTHNPRLSEEVLPHSPVDRMCAKRTRSGLSVRLPSLVELPGAEARCAAQDASPDGGSGHAHHRSYCHAGSAPVSVLPGAHIDMAELAAARSAHAGLSQFSMSSPDGVLGAPELMGNSVEEATGDAKFSAGETLAVAIAAAKFSTPVLTRIRQSVVCGERDTQSSAEPAPTPDSTGQGPAQGVAMGVQGRPCVSDQKQRGGLKVLQLLETTQEDMRTKWLQQLLCQRTSSMQEPSQFINTPPRFQNSAGKSHDDIPYLAPEVLEGGEPSTAADCFAFGVILYEVLQRELVAGEVAMHADLNTLTDEDALKRYASRVVEGERPHVPVSWPAELREVVQLCWQDDVFKRPVMAVVHAALISFSTGSSA